MRFPAWLPLWLAGAVLASAASAASTEGSSPRLQRIASDYQCTLYFTPVERGYVPKRGFRAPSVTLPIRPKPFSPDFLKAVRMEGFGRLDPPAPSGGYLRHDGHWRVAEAPNGSGDRRLVPRLSCAVAMRASGLRLGRWVFVRSPELPLVLRASPWRVDDVGSGVGPRQIDLYWGEDVSRNATDGLHEAASMPLCRISGVSVYDVAPDSTLLWAVRRLDGLHLFGLADALLDARLREAEPTR